MRNLLRSLLLVLTLCGPVLAEGPSLELFPLTKSSPIAARGAQVEVSAAIVPADQPGVIWLQVKVVLPEGANTYSMDPSLPRPTRITLEAAGWTAVDQNFIPDPPPKKAFDENFQQDVEKFYGTVVFSRRYTLPAGTNVKSATVNGKIDLLVCDKDNCMPKSEKFSATYSAKPLTKMPALSLLSPAEQPAAQAIQQTAAVAATPEGNTPLAYGYEITPQRPGRGGATADPIRLQFELSPEHAQPGETVTLAVTMTLSDGWTTYGLERADDGQVETPTSLELKPHNLQESGNWVSIPEPEVHLKGKGADASRSNAHEHQVTWKHQFRVESAGTYGVEGTIRYQLCESGKCLRPLGVPFSLGDVQQSAHLAGGVPVVKSFVDIKPVGFAPASAKSVDVVEEDLFALQEEDKIESLSLALVFAFLGGLMLNVMPCVLPVLAIKILSLVQQSGESQRRMLGLNLAYTGGVISVFLVLATMAATLQLGWGAQFQNTSFTIAMTLIVFAMGLSLLGVYELPIPGLVPSAHHHTEGYAGAFNTGIIATLLATPCTGPFMVPVFGFTLKQPTPVIYLIFGTMGLGMASPYLLAALFPAVVNWLPRPGMWMVRFKQFSGFVLMGTVIWLLSTIDLAMQVPTLVLLLGAGLALWMMGNLYDAASPASVKWRTRIATLIITLPIFAYGVRLLDRVAPVGKDTVALETISQPEVIQGRPDEIPWSPFSEERMMTLRKNGQPMLIDFTADWCGICKWNERWALNTTPVVEYLREHNITPLMADYTRENEEIRKWLNHFQQDSVPLTVVIPPGKAKIIALRGQYSQHQLLESLKAALGEVPEPAGNTGSETAAAANRPQSAGLEPSRGLSR